MREHAPVPHIVMWDDVKVIECTSPSRDPGVTVDPDLLLQFEPASAVTVVGARHHSTILDYLQ